MSIKVKRLGLITVLLLLSGCATAPKSRIAASLVGAGVGAGVGYAVAPEGERKEMHAISWGGVAGLLTAIIANYYFDDDTQKNQNLKLENERLKTQVEFLSANKKETLLRDAKGKTSDGKKNTRIKLYEIDEWVDEGPNIKYHRDKKLEVLPDK